MTKPKTLFGNIPVGGFDRTNKYITYRGHWAPGTVVMDASKITNYYQNQPDRRTVFVLNASNGNGVYL